MSWRTVLVGLAGLAAGTVLVLAYIGLVAITVAITTLIEIGAGTL